MPDASTISQNRRRRFNQSDICQEVFGEIAFQAIRRGLVAGKTLYTDSTHLKANANKNKFRPELVDKSTRGYIAELDRDVAEDRREHGKNPSGERAETKEPKETKVSSTDPDSGCMVRDGKPKGFFYLDHRTVDGGHGLITDSHVTPGNVHDSIPCLLRLDRQRERFVLEALEAGLDAGCFSAPICHGLVMRDIYGVIGCSCPTRREGYLRKNDFVYDEYYNCYLCPATRSCNTEPRLVKATGSMHRIPRYAAIVI